MPCAWQQGVTGSDTPLDGSTLPTVGSEADWDVGALDESATVIVPAKRRWRQVLTITVGLLVDAAILGGGSPGGSRYLL